MPKRLAINHFSKTATYLSCTGDSVGYRFGFNGQEKDNEVTGIEGSHNTAEYWMYDTRLGRRWNVDPVDQISISNYACFGNNPIFNIDIKGNKSEGWIKDKDGKASYDKDINNQSDLEDAQRNGRLCDYTYEGQQALVTQNDKVYFGDEKGVLHNQVNLLPVIIEGRSMYKYYTEKMNRSFNEQDLISAFSAFISRETGMTPDIDNSGNLGVAGSLEVNTAFAVGYGRAGSFGLFWTENNKVALYTSTQEITHGLVFSIAIQSTLYQDVKKNGVTIDNFMGRGYQTSMGLGPLGYFESYNYDNKNGEYGNEYIGRGISIGVGLEGLPGAYTTGPTYTYELK